jgi:hypothetical protein
MAEQEFKYTIEQLNEFVRCSNDPKYFIDNYCTTHSFHSGYVPLKLRDYQKDMIDVFHNNERSISVMARQLGTTTCALAYLIWYATFSTDKTIFIGGMNGAQHDHSRILYDMFSRLPDFLKEQLEFQNKNEMRFGSGSRIIIKPLSFDTTRGMAINLFYLPEFSYVDSKKASEFWHTITPTLTLARPKVIVTSCVNPFANNTYNDILTNATAYNFAVFTASWKDNSELNQDWADKMALQIGEDAFKIEYNCG